MAKFKINERVQIKSTGEFGTVKGRDIIPIDGSKKFNVEYIVKVGEGIANWKPFTKNELQSLRKPKEEKNVYKKVYDVVDGYKIMMYGKVTNIYSLFDDVRALNVGYAIYSPADEYNEVLGFKIARKRSRTSPFCKMRSDFSGEFNEATVNAILDVKADYIKNNLDHFINRSRKVD